MNVKHCFLYTLTAASKKVEGQKNRREMRRREAITKMNKLAAKNV
jgi:hypothetical protein